MRIDAIVLSLSKALVWVVSGLFVFIVLLAPVDAAQAASNEIEGNFNEAPVIVDGVTLFQVRGISAFPAEKRASQIAERIRSIAANSSIPADSIKVANLDRGSRITAGEQVLLIVFDEDALLEQIDRYTLADVYARRISEAIQHYRFDRTAKFLLKSILYMLAASIALVVFLWGARTVSRRIDGVLNTHLKTKLEGIETQSFRLLSATHLWRVLRAVQYLVWTAAILIVVILYLNSLLSG
jgi:hypothetical protein